MLFNGRFYAKIKKEKTRFRLDCKSLIKKNHDRRNIVEIKEKYCESKIFIGVRKICKGNSSP